MELNVENTNLEELESIDPDITIINCSNNRLTTLPELPSLLQSLDCNHNRLRELPTLPSSLQSLDCTYNRLRTLPTLPSLQTLKCGHNSQLRELPTLPPSLQTLICRFSGIRNLNLPATLLNLSIIHCEYCELREIPVLPPNVREFDCQYNSISVILGPLPAGLTTFTCAANMLTELPDLPDSLVQLDCNSNRLVELPTLPNGIEYVDCGFNRIPVLPALPDSLTVFICIRNPLTLASFNMFRERFQFQELNPTDYPAGFVQPVAAAAEEEPAEELTEGDQIEERNIANQYEVHQAFDKLDLSKLYPVIDSDTPSYNAENLFGFIRELVHTNTLDEEEHARIISLFERFTENIRDTFTCIADPETKRLISAVLAYVGRQNPEFKNNYIRFFIDDISSAYEFNPEIPDLATASCAKGIKERIIMSLKSATLGQSEAYQPLLRAFVHKIPIDIMRQFTSDCMKDARVKEMLESNITMDEKVRILASCIREKMQGTEYFPSGGAEELPDPPEFSEYIATLKFGLEGGKRKKTRKLKKTKRKIKKTKRKIKKTKLSKKKIKSFH